MEPSSNTGKNFRLPKLKDELLEEKFSMYSKLIHEKLKSFKEYNPYKESYKQIQKQRITQYPKLVNFIENQPLSTVQQKTLKKIVQKKPALAASLDLYASNKILFLDKKTYNINSTVNNLMNNSTINNSNHESQA